MTDVAVSKLSALLNETASDSTADPVERLANLRGLRTDLAALVGQADTYIADQQAIREASAMDRIHDHVGARENANVRSLMLVKGMSTPEQLTAAGFLDHDDLDRRVMDGTIEEAVVGSAYWELLREATERAPVQRPAPAGEPSASQPTTADVYSRTNGKGKRVYDQSRAPVHRAIIDKLLKGHEPVEKPSVLFTGGDSQGVDVPDDAVTIDVPSIRKQLPEHQAMSGDPEADLLTHDEAMDVAGQAEHEARHKKLNMVMTGLASDQAGQMVNRVEQYRKAGYGQALASYGGDPELAEAYSETILDEAWADAARVASLETRRRHAHHIYSVDEIHNLGLDEYPKPGPAAREILHEAADTQELYRAKGMASPGLGGPVYSIARKPLHDKLVGGALHDPVSKLLGVDHPISQKLANGETLSDGEKKTVHEAADKARGGNKPVALFMAGGAASGKSASLKHAPEMMPGNAVRIDPDAMKVKIPEYQQISAKGDRSAATVVHEESTDLANRSYHEARDLGLNMVIDGAGDSEQGKFVRKLHEADDAGYDVRSMYVTVPTDTAITRSVERAAETGRFMPVPKIKDQHRNVSRNFPEVAKLPFISNMKVFDNRLDHQPKLIAHGGGGELVADDPTLYQEFLDKGNG